MELEADLGLVASTSFQPLDVLIKPLPVTKPPLPQYILGIAKRHNKEKEEHKWTEEEQNKKDKEQNRMEKEERLKEEERAEIEAARKEYLKIVLSRMKLMRKVGRPATLMYCKNLDARELLSRKSNCDEIKWESGPVDKEILLEKERALWNAAMEYRKVQNMDSEYDLVASKMTFFPIMSRKCMWYHCNLVGCKRETPLKVMQQYFFLEINRTRGKTDTLQHALHLMMTSTIPVRHVLPIVAFCIPARVDLLVEAKKPHQQEPWMEMLCHLAYLLPCLPWGMKPLGLPPEDYQPWLEVELPDLAHLL